MKIGLIDVDSHNFPNLALMKISAWHKARGDSVEWYQPLFSGHMDKVYMSKVFSFTPDYEYFIDSDEIYRGGVRVLYLSGKRQRAVRRHKRQFASAGDRTHLSGLWFIRNRGYRLRIFNTRLPARMQILHRGRERGCAVT